MDTAEQSLLNERYQRGAEMLGSDVLSVRLDGIYALDRLAAEQPASYHIQIMQLFCAFARRPHQHHDDKPPNPQELTCDYALGGGPIRRAQSRTNCRIQPRDFSEP